MIIFCLHMKIYSHIYYIYLTHMYCKSTIKKAEIKQIKAVLCGRVTQLSYSLPFFKFDFT